MTPSTRTCTLGSSKTIALNAASRAACWLAEPVSTAVKKTGVGRCSEGSAWECCAARPPAKRPVSERQCERGRREASCESRRFGGVSRAMPGAGWRSSVSPVRVALRPVAAHMLPMPASRSSSVSSPRRACSRVKRCEERVRSEAASQQATRQRGSRQRGSEAAGNAAARPHSPSMALTSLSPVRLLMSVSPGCKPPL